MTHLVGRDRSWYITRIAYWIANWVYEEVNLPRKIFGERYLWPLDHLPSYYRELKNHGTLEGYTCSADVFSFEPNNWGLPCSFWGTYTSTTTTTTPSRNILVRLDNGFTILVDTFLDLPRTVDFVIDSFLNGDVLRAIPAAFGVIVDLFTFLPWFTDLLIESILDVAIFEPLEFLGIIGPKPCKVSKGLDLTEDAVDELSGQYAQSQTCESDPEVPFLIYLLDPFQVSYDMFWFWFTWKGFLIYSFFALLFWIRHKMGAIWFHQYITLPVKNYINLGRPAVTALRLLNTLFTLILPLLKMSCMSSFVWIPRYMAKLEKDGDAEEEVDNFVYDPDGYRDSPDLNLIAFEKYMRFYSGESKIRRHAERGFLLSLLVLLFYGLPMLFLKWLLVFFGIVRKDYFKLELDGPIRARSQYREDNSDPASIDSSGSGGLPHPLDSYNNFSPSFSNSTDDGLKSITTSLDGLAMGDEEDLPVVLEEDDMETDESFSQLINRKSRESRASRASSRINSHRITRSGSGVVNTEDSDRTSSRTGSVRKSSVHEDAFVKRKSTRASQRISSKGQRIGSGRGGDAEGGSMKLMSEVTQSQGFAVVAEVPPEKLNSVIERENEEASHKVVVLEERSTQLKSEIEILKRQEEKIQQFQVEAQPVIEEKQRRIKTLEKGYNQERSSIKKLEAKFKEEREQGSKWDERYQESRRRVKALEKEREQLKQTKNPDSITLDKTKRLDEEIKREKAHGEDQKAKSREYWSKADTIKAEVKHRKSELARQGVKITKTSNEKKEIETKLRETEKQLQEISESITAKIIVVDHIQAESTSIIEHVLDVEQEAMRSTQGSSFMQSSRFNTPSQAVTPNLPPVQEEDEERSTDGTSLRNRTTASHRQTQVVPERKHGSSRGQSISAGLGSIIFDKPPEDKYATSLVEPDFSPSETGSPSDSLDHSKFQMPKGSSLPVSVSQTAGFGFGHRGFEGMSLSSHIETRSAGSVSPSRTGSRTTLTHMKSTDVVGKSTGQTPLVSSYPSPPFQKGSPPTPGQAQRSEDFESRDIREKPSPADRAAPTTPGEVLSPEIDFANAERLHNFKEHGKLKRADSLNKRMSLVLNESPTPDAPKSPTTPTATAKSPVVLRESQSTPPPPSQMSSLNNRRSPEGSKTESSIPVYNNSDGVVSSSGEEIPSELAQALYMGAMMGGMDVEDMVEGLVGLKMGLGQGEAMDITGLSESQIEELMEQMKQGNVMTQPTMFPEGFFGGSSEGSEDPTGTDGSSADFFTQFAQAQAAAAAQAGFEPDSGSMESETSGLTGETDFDMEKFWKAQQAVYLQKMAQAQQRASKRATFVVGENPTSSSLSGPGSGSVDADDVMSTTGNQEFKRLIEQQGTVVLGDDSDDETSKAKVSQILENLREEYPADVLTDADLETEIEGDASDVEDAMPPLPIIINRNEEGLLQENIDDAREFDTRFESRNLDSRPDDSRQYDTRFDGEIRKLDSRPDDSRQYDTRFEGESRKVDTRPDESRQYDTRFEASGRADTRKEEREGVPLTDQELGSEFDTQDDNSEEDRTTKQRATSRKNKSSRKLKSSRKQESAAETSPTNRDGTSRVSDPHDRRFDTITLGEDDAEVRGSAAEVNNRSEPSRLRLSEIHTPHDHKKGDATQVGAEPELKGIGWFPKNPFDISGGGSPQTHAANSRKSGFPAEALGKPKKVDALYVGKGGVIYGPDKKDKPGPGPIVGSPLGIHGTIATEEVDPIPDQNSSLESDDKSFQPKKIRELLSQQESGVYSVEHEVREGKDISHCLVGE